MSAATQLCICVMTTVLLFEVLRTPPGEARTRCFKHFALMCAHAHGFETPDASYHAQLDFWKSKT